MSYKDTLTLYDELVAAGTSEAQARAQAQQLGAVGNVLERIERDLLWMRITGAVIAVGVIGMIFK